MMALKFLEQSQHPLKLAAEDKTKSHLRDASSAAWLMLHVLLLRQTYNAG